MAMTYMSMETLKYLLFEVHEAEKFLQHPRFQSFDRDALDVYLDAVKEYADRELFPAFREMDAEPVRYEDGKVVVHPCVQNMMQQAGELGLIGGTFDEAHGGMQMPKSLSTAAYFILDTANNHVTGYPALTEGAARLLVSFGDAALQRQFVPHMLRGKWGGTMCLTEPQAGSSLSDIRTTAFPQEDGTYRLKGQKIFISAGDYQYAENIVHLVLARIEGAPRGTKGISLFAVPKHRPQPDGCLLPNDVHTLADFPKMGQKGYATVHLSFGDGDNCQAWLVGAPHKGLKYMFQMMNSARISVGRHATAVATAAYYASLQYAKERPQGRKLNQSGTKDPSEAQTLIINHPDVRRMLLLQKAICEGALSLVLQSAHYHDQLNTQEGEDRENSRLLLELLTPVTKTYPSEMGIVSVSNGLQVLGGYGFCSEYILQQYYRDIRIMSIYEGTTGIQSLDLLGRKLFMQEGKALKLLGAEVEASLEAAMKYEELQPYARQLAEKLQVNQQIMAHLLPFAQRGEHERFLADANLYMEFFSMLVIAWQWLKMGTHAKVALLGGARQHEASFYESKLHTMKFFYKYELPKTLGLAQSLLDEHSLTLSNAREAYFS